MADSVTLNVGGEHMTVARKTVQLFPYSLLASVIQQQQQQDGDATGTSDTTAATVFIDRNAKYFQYLIDFLRNNGRLLRRIPPEDIDCVRQEFEYFQIPLPLLLSDHTLASIRFGTETIQLEVKDIDLRTAETGRSLISETHMSIVYYPDHNELAHVVVWCAKTLQQLHILPMPADIVHVAIHQNVAVYGHSDGVVQVWDYTCGQILASFNTEGQEVNRVNINQHLVGAAMIGGNLRIWSSSTWTLLYSFSNCHPRQIHFNGLHALFVKDMYIHMVDTVTGHTVNVWPSPFKDGQFIVAEQDLLFLIEGNEDYFNVHDLKSKDMNSPLVQHGIFQPAGVTRSITFSINSGTMLLVNLDAPAHIYVVDLLQRRYLHVVSDRLVDDAYHCSNAFITVHNGSRPQLWRSHTWTYFP